MLINLTINDLAVVKTLDLDLHKGMSVLTGETGAGKSILLTALGLALGGRADAGYIRPHCKRAEVNLHFDLSDAPAAQQWLQEQDMDDEQACIIRRVVSQDGRSKAFINNAAVNLQTLQTFSAKLVEIHGQHAHLTLLNAGEQLRVVDDFAKNQVLLEALNACYQTWLKASKESAHLKKTSAASSAREEVLLYQIEELQQLDLAQFDYQVLTEEHSRLANFQEIFDTGNKLVEQLYDAPSAVVSVINQGVTELTQLARFASELTDIVQLLTEAHLQTEEAAKQLRRFLDSQDADPARLEMLDKQLALVHNLSRKHHITPEELPAQLQQLEQELRALTHGSERIAGLEQSLAPLIEQYTLLATQLSSRRHQGAALLSQQISLMIKELGMPQGEFIVDVTTLEHHVPKLSGWDAVTFLVSANPGLPPKPLAKVASGGELSRISLAIQVTTSHDKSTPTMIFDEVDSGIGGGIAEIVGQKLRALGSDRQVLCVTHLPQVAAQAHQHLYVEKNHQAEITTSHVRLLSLPERIDETARMLGGVTITANTLAHATEMLVHSSSN